MQPKYFLSYLSNAPVLAVLTVSLLFTAFILINKSFPDGLSMTP